MDLNKFRFNHISLLAKLMLYNILVEYKKKLIQMNRHTDGQSALLIPFGFQNWQLQ